LSPAYRETIGRTITELDMLRENLASGLECYRNAWDSLRMIREAVETLAPPGAVRSEEAVLATLGPEPVHEAQAIIEGIQKLAAAKR
jgi:hypothetical protein